MKCKELTSALRKITKNKKLRTKVQTAMSILLIYCSPLILIHLNRVKLNFIKLRKKLAFTLAETLITLTLIGVVAAMTVPALTNSINEMQYKSAFKKTYAEIQQTYQKLISENGGFYQCNIIASPWTTTSNECPKFWTDFKANMKVIKECDASNNATLGNCLPKSGILNQNGTEKSGDCLHYNVAGQNRSHAFVLNDGTYYFIYPDGTNSYYSYFAVDINGQKQPNQWGKDVYGFIIQDNKLVNEGYCGSSGQSILNETR